MQVGIEGLVRVARKHFVSIFETMAWAVPRRDQSLVGAHTSLLTLLCALPAGRFLSPRSQCVSSNAVCCHS